MRKLIPLLGHRPVGQADNSLTSVGATLSAQSRRCRGHLVLHCRFPEPDVGRMRSILAVRMAATRTKLLFWQLTHPIGNDAHPTCLRL
jgi:hypothetical protein